MPVISVKRIIGKRTSDEKVAAQIDYLCQRGLKGSRGSGWEVNKTRNPARQVPTGWLFEYKLDFNKVRGQRGGDAEYNQWEQIKAMIIQSGQSTKFQNAPWTVTDEDGLTHSEIVQAQNPPPEPNDDVPNPPNEILPDNTAATLTDLMGEISNKVIIKLGGVREVHTGYSKVLTFDDLIVPDELLGPHSDEALAEHPNWKNLYGIGPQIRTLLSVIKRGHDTGGNSRNHGVLYGDAGCGKTSTFLALEEMFGPGSVLRLDATSTTRPGIEKLFFKDLPEIPPIVLLEEAEKADPEGLKVWLGALDDRGEIRKVNFKVNMVREVRVLFFTTVNNKTLFDRLMGSDGSTAGALSSRCSTQIYYPRPSPETLRLILRKEINEKGGMEEWINPCIDLARELQVTDPRVVRSFLSGGERLMTGAYQADRRAIHKVATNN